MNKIFFSKENAKKGKSRTVLETNLRNFCVMYWKVVFLTMHPYASLFPLLKAAPRFSMEKEHLSGVSAGSTLILVPGGTP